ncbi:MAG TPA: peptidoglycan bridge formation glycyltransferase FemA/FemB family protein [Candidatus Sulfotelmatobacter sp.]|nr:peptidoglycan bridge formation glycyltransferase FemA/FemB family protein [Candidatus Sulfotelmatobacter sp.]
MTRPVSAQSDWDEFLEESGGHFLQSTAWQEVLRALGNRVVCRRDREWTWAAVRRASFGFAYLYSPYGPTLAGSALAEAVGEAREVAGEEAADFLRLEPLGSVTPEQLRAVGARRSRSIQPRHTWVLDLDADEKSLRSGLSEGHRGSINAASRRGLSFRKASSPEEATTFLSLLHRVAQARPDFKPHHDTYYRTCLEVLMPRGAASLYLAERQGEAVAGTIVYDFSSTRYYAHASADPVQGRKLSAAAPLVWHAILEAQAAGMRHFDFWGVAPDDDPAHPWHGLSKFKKAFGGRLVERAGTWDIVLRPLRYGIYSLGRRVVRSSPASP